MSDESGAVLMAEDARGVVALLKNQLHGMNNWFVSLAQQKNGTGNLSAAQAEIDKAERLIDRMQKIASGAVICRLATADQAEREIGHDIDAELLQFKLDSLRRKLDACTQKERDFFWSIWKNAPCKATTPEELPEKHLMDSLRLCDRTLKAALQSPVTAGRGEG